MYKYALEECDVINKEQLRAFREKRAEWISWLHEDDRHSIWRQINQLLWDDILFRTINDLRRDAVERPTKESGFNGDILRLLDAGFLTTQVTTIRRLTDKPSPDPKKGVISLRRLLKDIEDHSTLVTRETYVAFDGLPYDGETARQLWYNKEFSAPEIAQCRFIPTTGPEAWDVAERVHKNFDRLSGVRPENRSRCDVIRCVWFDYLEEKLAACDDTRKYVDKFVAHAADKTSREGLTTEQTGITLNRLTTCYKAIYRVAAFIYGPLLWEGSYGLVPTPQYDHLENLDKPWVAPGDLDNARETWDRNVATVEAWEQEPLWPENLASVTSSPKGQV